MMSCSVSTHVYMYSVILQLHHLEVQTIIEVFSTIIKFPLAVSVVT